MINTTGPRENDVLLDDLIDAAKDLRLDMKAIRRAESPPSGWYPYDSLSNLQHLDRLLEGEHRSITRLSGGLPIADIGAADGEMSFLLDRLGFEVDIIDYSPTNANGLEGARLLAKRLGAEVRVIDTNIDRLIDGGFGGEGREYGLALFLGILYHLKNPFLAMEQLATNCRRCLISTRITRLAPDRIREISDLSLAYLVDRTELNSDPTNFWIFTEVGLRRLFSRTGWRVVSAIAVGDTKASDPISMDHDERFFALLENARFFPS